jgi:hypothetical protein
MRGPHGIPGDPCRGNLLAASAFDGGIKAEEHDTAGDEHGSEEPEQESTGIRARSQISGRRVIREESRS